MNNLLNMLDVALPTHVAGDAVMRVFPWIIIAVIIGAVVAVVVLIVNRGRLRSYKMRETNNLTTNKEDRKQ